MIEKKVWSKRILLILCSLVVMMACSLNVSAATAKLNYRQKSVYKGNTVKLTVTGGTVASWTSSRTSVATVSGSGKVTGKTKGTTTITATLKSGKKLTCTINVRKKVRSTYLTNAQSKVMLNILGAVETGGQVYGQRDYTDFIGPYAASPGEHSSTAGAYQEFGDNLRQLLVAIKTQYPLTFSKYDTANIASDLKRTWSASNPYKVYPGSKKARAIVNIIGSNNGRRVQDLRAVDLIDSYLKHIKSLGVTNVRAALFMAECEHLGGAAAVERVVRRATNKNSIYSLRKSLYKDQKDTSNSYQIGDTFYQLRHEKCYGWLVKYISSSAKLK